MVFTRFANELGGTYGIMQMCNIIELFNFLHLEPSLGLSSTLAELVHHII